VSGSQDDCKAKIYEGDLGCSLVEYLDNKDAFGTLWVIAPSGPFFLELLKILLDPYKTSSHFWIVIIPWLTYIWVLLFEGLDEGKNQNSIGHNDEQISLCHAISAENDEGMAMGEMNHRYQPVPG
jgi:hypothetical protein